MTVVPMLQMVKLRHKRATPKSFWQPKPHLKQPDPKAKVSHPRLALSACEPSSPTRPMVGTASRVLKAAENLPLGSRCGKQSRPFVRLILCSFPLLPAPKRGRKKATGDFGFNFLPPPTFDPPLPQLQDLPLSHPTLDLELESHSPFSE